MPEEEKQSGPAAPLYQPPPYQPAADPARLVAHWEIQNMINASISHYDQTVAGPRFIRIEGCITRVERLLANWEGAAVVVKWSAAAAGLAGTLAGIVYSIGKITGHL